MPKKRAVLLVLLAATTSLPAVAGAQAHELTPGAKVRVLAPTVFDSRYEATIGARRGDTLSLVRQDAPPRDVMLVAVTRLDLSRGRSRRAGALRGMLWGAGIGLAMGAINATGFGKDPNTMCRTMTCGGSVLTDGIQMVIGGTVWGAGVGALVRRESWSTVIDKADGSAPGFGKP